MHLALHGADDGQVRDAADVLQFGLEAMATWMLAESRRAGRVLRDANRFMSDEHSTEMYEDFMTHLYMPVEAVLKAGVERGEFRSHDTTLST